MYIELKAFQSPGEGSTPRKTKIQLNVGTPFSADANTEIDKEKLQPKKVYDILQFIARDLIPRIVIKYNQAAFDTELKVLQGLRGTKTWEQFFEDASPTDKAKFDETELAMLNKAIASLHTFEVPEINQLNFEELSPRVLAVYEKGVINTNVPPPRSPGS